MALPPADTVIVYGKTQPEAGAHGITAFVIEKGMKVGWLRTCLTS
jgi:isovaleryl-CoA dehydrogenase